MVDIFEMISRAKYYHDVNDIQVHRHHRQMSTNDHYCRQVRHHDHRNHLKLHSIHNLFNFLTIYLTTLLVHMSIQLIN
jgi:hypothetical protein